MRRALNFSFFLMQCLSSCFAQSLNVDHSLSQAKLVENNQFCEIYLMRHGETDWNTQDLLQGHSDVPLNKKGEMQALDVAKKLREIDFAAVCSSDLSRAFKTAEIIIGFKKIPMDKTPKLRERSFGAWEGRKSNELKKWLSENTDVKEHGLTGMISTINMSKDEYLNYRWCDFTETYLEIYTRAKDVINYLVPVYLGVPVLVSTHAGVLRAVLYNLDFRSGFEWQVSNCAFIKLRAYMNGTMELIEYDGIESIEIQKKS